MAAEIMKNTLADFIKIKQSTMDNLAKKLVDSLDEGNVETFKEILDLSRIGLRINVADPLKPNISMSIISYIMHKHANNPIIKKQLIEECVKPEHQHPKKLEEILAAIRAADLNIFQILFFNDWFECVKSLGDLTCLLSEAISVFVKHFLENHQSPLNRQLSGSSFHNSLAILNCLSKLFIDGKHDINKIKSTINLNVTVYLKKLLTKDEKNLFDFYPAFYQFLKNMGVQDYIEPLEENSKKPNSSNGGNLTKETASINTDWISNLLTAISLKDFSQFGDILRRGLVDVNVKINTKFKDAFFIEDGTLIQTIIGAWSDGKSKEKKLFLQEIIKYNPTKNLEDICVALQKLDYVALQFLVDHGWLEVLKNKEDYFKVISKATLILDTATENLDKTARDPLNSMIVILNGICKQAIDNNVDLKELTPILSHYKNKINQLSSALGISTTVFAAKFKSLVFLINGARLQNGSSQKKSVTHESENDENSFSASSSSSSSFSTFNEDDERKELIEACLKRLEQEGLIKAPLYIIHLKEFQFSINTSASYYDRFLKEIQAKNSKLSFIRIDESRTLKNPNLYIKCSTLESNLTDLENKIKEIFKNIKDEQEKYSYKQRNSTSSIEVGYTPSSTEIKKKNPKNVSTQPSINAQKSSEIASKLAARHAEKAAEEAERKWKKEVEEKARREASEAKKKERQEKWIQKNKSMNSNPNNTVLILNPLNNSDQTNLTTTPPEKPKESEFVFVKKEVPYAELVNGVSFWPANWNGFLNHLNKEYETNVFSDRSPSYLFQNDIEQTPGFKKN